MTLITTSNLGKSFGPDDIFSEVSISIPPRARIGLVGANGSGKTTLLHILVGLDDPSQGQVNRARNLATGYLPQEVKLDLEGTIWEACREVFSDLLVRQSVLADLEIEMADPARAEAVMERYGALQEAFERLGGYTFETRIRQVLSGLGFTRADFDRPVRQLSGGQRTRAQLARLLLESSDLLLLDEPTNHLDVAAIEWLEGFLKDWPGAVVCVSHDRYFLDQVASTIWEMASNVEVYRGNYSAYLTQREARYQRHLEAYQAQQTFIEKEEDYIRRNIAGQNTRQAKGRRKRLERLLETAKLAPPPTPRRLSLNMQAAMRSGDLVVRTYDLSVGYADEGRPLFKVPDLVLRRGECAAIIGPNGAGKTTFFKTLLGEVPPLEGETQLGASIEIGYFAQAHEGLNPELTLIEEIEAVSKGMLPADIRNYLARYMFTGDDVFRAVGTLSGGERGRLALAMLALSSANLLLLDEPTNHLDLPSQEVLQAVLANFRGTILLVSHDRYLVDSLATQVWDAQPETTELRVYKGSYSDYQAANQMERLASSKNTPEKENGASRWRDPEQRVAARIARRQAERRSALETEISELEGKLAGISQRLETPPADLAEVERLGAEYADLQQTLDECLVEWTEL
jgi:ATP-binding cassette, subfamily F, member 3